MRLTAAPVIRLLTWKDARLEQSLVCKRREEGSELLLRAYAYLSSRAGTSETFFLLRPAVGPPASLESERRLLDLNVGLAILRLAPDSGMSGFCAL